MLQTIEQTQEEKMTMYMKLSKKKLAEMLINCNNILNSYPKRITNCPVCTEEMKGIELTHYKCKHCNEYFTN